MKVRKDGSKQAVIIEHDGGWSVKTSVIRHDIIYPLDHVNFKVEPECIKYVTDFFDVKKPAK